MDKSDVYQNLDRGDGTCRYLEGNLCSIYSQRPVLCRVDECYELYFKERYSLEEYYEMNYRICKKLQNEGG